ncbi:MAG: type IV pilus assembly protein PilM [Myxococcota bacterium]
MFFNVNKARPVIGLDIGSHTVKVVELKPGRKGHQLVNLGIASLPPEAIVDGALLNSSAIVEAIQSLLANNNIKTKDVATAVSGHSVIIKKIALPAMTDEELEEQIQWEAEQYIPFDVNDVNIDFQILSNGFESDGKMDVLLVAAKKELINDYVNVITEAGLRPAVIDVEAFAVETMFESNYRPGSEEVVALVNIGASIVNINVAKNGLPAFTRDISLGGNQYTEEIQKTLHVSFPEAESIKLGGTPALSGKEILPEEVDQSMRGVSETLSSEIQRSLEFFGATAPDDRVSRILLSGGCSQMSRLPEIIEEKTRIPVEISDPFKSIECDPKLIDEDYLREVGPSVGVGVGLALRTAGA